MAKPKDTPIVGAVWVKKTGEGKTYLSISMGEMDDENKKSYVAWKVKEKSSENSPDYIIKESQPMEKKKKKVEDEEDDDLL